ncbi:LacI family transcriptional regulator [Puniceicoccales bacterium CK1056]|uniref:LacI family transcriptional regulator n=1 Tax=Oceanipulchritudo coccoides TaxID=2706888 RepID=A0A6B2LZI5_9BACT|nr:LacI family DNA-binding transcriptional regulator [Oceanipulchritudo coccoides]NDV61476.1 LacI family transcriptional regulator [Oceanipulchritudo coccoides]
MCADNPQKTRSSKKSRPTIYDLAEMAGVSTGTVSRALNNRPMVSAETRERILDMAHRIGLKPQAAVRIHQIAIISEPTYRDHVVGYAAAMTANISLALAKKGVGIIVPSDPRTLLSGSFFDGIIAVTWGPELKDFLKEMESRVPVVYLDNFAADSRQYVVSSDHYASGFQAAKLFLERGRKRLAIATHKADPMQERLRGFRDGINQFGGTADERLLALAPAGESLYSIVSRLVRQKADAVFVPGVSMEVIEALHVIKNVMRLRIPEDLAVIGGENEKISKFLTPPLTAIDEPIKKMAEAATDMVLALSEGQKVPTRQVLFPVELIERESV